MLQMSTAPRLEVGPSRVSFQSSSSSLPIPVGVQRHPHLAARPRRRCSRSPARLVCNATESTAPVIQEAGTEDLSGEDKEQWQDGLQQLKGLGMADDEAEKSLKRGFGWSSQAYWWKDKVREVPKPGEIKAKLDYLRELGMNNQQLHEAVKHFPETVGLDLDKRMKPNVELMGKKFFIKGKMLPKTLARKPQALGYAVDCEGDCQGDCTRCWSHF
ncbi:TPA: hypothetical protein ACH3X2_000324 [Trebouxia sp. C0005]